MPACCVCRKAYGESGDWHFVTSDHTDPAKDVLHGVYCGECYKKYVACDDVAAGQKAAIARFHEMLSAN